MFQKKPNEEANFNSIEEGIITIVNEINVIQLEKYQCWWQDTCATVHVSYDDRYFQ